MKAATRTDTTPGEALAVVAICFGWAIYSSLASLATDANVSRPFTDAGLMSIVVIESIVAALALALLAARRYDVASLLPRPNWRDSGVGVMLLSVAFLAGMLAMSLFADGQGEQPIERMMRHATITPPALIMMAVVNGTFEEVFLLGFLQRGLRAYGTSTALGVTLLLRLLYHVYQGPLGVMYVLGVGLVLGLYFARWNKLWPAVLAHIFWDIVPFLS